MTVRQLFPDDTETVVVNPTSVKSRICCTILDCLLNQELSLRQLFMERFKTTADGGLELRLQHSLYSHCLDPDWLTASGYDYRYDTYHEQDLFIITPGTVDTIDSDKTDIETNALAVKIFFNIIEFYFAATLEEMGQANAEYSTEKDYSIFYAQLLGFKLTVNQSDLELEKVFQQKLSQVHQLCYLSCTDKGSASEPKAITERCFFRIKSVRRDNEQWQISVINQTDGGVEQNLMFSDLMARQACVYHLSCLSVPVHVNNCQAIAVDDSPLVKQAVMDIVIDTLIDLAIVDGVEEGLSASEATVRLHIDFLNFFLSRDPDELKTAARFKETLAFMPETMAIVLAKKIDLTNPLFHMLILDKVSEAYHLTHALDVAESKQVVLWMVKEYCLTEDENHLTTHANFRSLFINRVLEPGAFLSTFGYTPEVADNSSGCWMRAEHFNGLRQEAMNCEPANSGLFDKPFVKGESEQVALNHLKAIAFSLLFPKQSSAESRIDVFKPIEFKKQYQRLLFAISESNADFRVIKRIAKNGLTAELPAEVEAFLSGIAKVMSAQDCLESLPKSFTKQLKELTNPNFYR